MKTPFVLLAIVVMITGVSLTNQTQTVESSNDKEKFLQAVNFLENNPLDEKAKKLANGLCLTHAKWMLLSVKNCHPCSLQIKFEGRL